MVNATVKAGRVTLNSRGMREMLRSDQVRAIIDPIADNVAAQARATAPVSTGAYRDSIHVTQATTDRAVARVVADAPHAAFVEARRGILARALSRAGR